jgi:hypothetical protein
MLLTERRAMTGPPPAKTEAMSVDDGYPGRTDLHLIFRVWGKDVDPEALTAATGIEPARSFHVGESGGSRSAYARTVAGWEWRDRCTQVVTTPLFDRALLALGPHEETFAQLTAVPSTTTISLTVAGFVYGEVIATPEEQERRGFAPDKPGSFKPSFEADRVEIWLDPEIMGFLSRIRATFKTHIDAALDDDPGS